MNQLRMVAVLFCSGLIASILWEAQAQPAARATTAQDSAAANDAFYTSHVAPILQANCLRCHGGMNHRGGLSMNSRESLLKGGESGPVIVPGHPEQSLLIHLVHQEGLKQDQKPMPPRGKLSPAEISTLEEWIRAGAAMPPTQ